MSQCKCCARALVQPHVGVRCEHAQSGPPSSGEELCPSRPHPWKCIVGREGWSQARWSSCCWTLLLQSVLMAFTPRGPEASFFEVLDQHRASLLAALRGGEGPAGSGMRLASRYTGSFWGTDGWELGSEKVLPSQAWGALWRNAGPPSRLPNLGSKATSECWGHRGLFGPPALNSKKGPCLVPPISSYSQFEKPGASHAYTPPPLPAVF